MSDEKKTNATYRMSDGLITASSVIYAQASLYPQLLDIIIDEFCINLSKLCNIK